jgi:probable DNA metabolism protein
MMIVYVYDGTFDGLLTAVYEAYYRRSKPDRLLSGANLQTCFIDEYIFIETDTEKSHRVYNSIKKKISSEALEHVYNVFLSNEEEPGTIILEYLKLGFRMGRRVDLNLADSRVLKVHNISRRVSHETHKMTGFVRFRRLAGDIYYAPINPDNNIIELLAPHFARRMPDHYWIIHDTARGTAAVYDLEEWVVTDNLPESLPDIEKDEPEYQKLWKEFFNSIAIAGRCNPRLQKRLMPVRYWRYLTEKW